MIPSRWRLRQLGQTENTSLDSALTIPLVESVDFPFEDLISGAPEVSFQVIREIQEPGSSYFLSNSFNLGLACRAHTTRKAKTKGNA